LTVGPAIQRGTLGRLRRLHDMGPRQSYL